MKTTNKNLLTIHLINSELRLLEEALQLTEDSYEPDLDIILDDIVSELKLEGIYE